MDFERIKAIVYTSNTGTTQEYAKMLGEQLALPVLSLYDAENGENALKKGSAVIYLGWIMAGQIRDYAKASRLFNVEATCAVGMMTEYAKREDFFARNKIRYEMPLFFLKGGYEPEKLRGIQKFATQMLVKMLIKDFEKKQNRTATDDEILALLKNGGRCVRAENLSEIINWYNLYMERK